MLLNLKIIREWVAKECDSQADAARRLGMRPAHFSRLLSGDRTDIPISTLKRFADVMRIDPAELIGWTKIV